MIVVGYLATREGRQGIASAVDESARRKTALTIVVSEKAAGLTDEARTERDSELEVISSDATRRGVEVDVQVLSQRHDVAEDLVAVAQETNAELIVIGLRRRSPVGKLILGSNAQRILLDAPCPVLAVKTERAR
ncbi:universal stress protein [Timonella senegalensis]|uniref:universal stress protein n=1 Tax=Timonella senegalensis TaxID=1465825 RepID=UPI0028AB6713|nr:universal stress protein [Timonella senegalensis]